MDVFEYIFAYKFQFGLIGVDFGAEGRTRYARISAKWYSGFLRGSELTTVASFGSRASS
jgi:beta-glucosidase